MAKDTSKESFGSFLELEDRSSSVFSSNASFLKDSGLSLASSNPSARTVPSEVSDFNFKKIEVVEDDIEEENASLKAADEELPTETRRAKIPIATFREKLKSYPGFLPKTQRERIEVTEQKIAGQNWYGNLDYRFFALLTIFSDKQIIYSSIPINTHGALPSFIAYVILMSLVGYPMMLLEAGLGQCISRGPGGCWKFARIFKGVGLSQIFRSAIRVSKTVAVIGWVSGHMYSLVTYGYPWESQNYKYFERFMKQLRVNMTVEPRNDNITQGLYIPMQEHHEQTDTHIWDLDKKTYAFFVINWSFAMLFLLPNMGIRGRIGSVLFLCIALVFIVICIRALSLPGAMKGIQYAFRSRSLEGLLHFRLWQDIGQSFIFNILMTPGLHMTLASYNHFNNNVVSDVMYILLAELFFNILGILLTFSLLGYLDETTAYTLETIRIKATQMIFIHQPYALSIAGSGTPWIITLLTLYIVCLHTTLTSDLEVITTGFIDLFDLRNRRQFVALTVCGVGLLSTVWSCTVFSWSIFIELNLFSDIVPLAVNSFLMLYAIAWVFGVTRFIALIECCVGWYTTLVLSHPRFKAWWRLCWKYVSPTMFLFYVVIGLRQVVGYLLLKKKKGQIGYLTVIGPTMWAVDFFLIFGTMIVLIVSTRTGGFNSRIKALTNPTTQFGPSLAQNRFILDIGERDRLKELEEAQARKSTVHKLPTRYKDLVY